MTRKIIAITAVVAVVIVGVWYFALLRPESSKIASLQTKEQQLQGQVMQMQSRYIALVASERGLPAERAILAKLRQAVPDGPQLDNLITTLYSAATRSGVKLSSISSPEPTGFGGGTVAGTSSGPVQLNLILDVTGPSDRIVALVKRLEAEPRLFVVDTFTVGGINAAATSASGPKGAHQSVLGSTVNLRAFYASGAAQSAAS